MERSVKHESVNETKAQRSADLSLAPIMSVDFILTVIFVWNQLDNTTISTYHRIMITSLQLILQLMRKTRVVK